MRKTHCKNEHPFAGDNVRVATNGQQVCRECLRAAGRRYDTSGARKKARTRCTVSKQAGVQVTPSRTRKDKTLADKQRRLFLNLVSRAKRAGIDCNLQLEDIVWPTHCPIFGTELDYFYSNKRLHAVPSFDRLEPSRGYVKGNVNVISYGANARKGDMTKEDVRRLFDYVNHVA